MPKYQTLGDVVIRSKVERQSPTEPILGQIYFDEDTGRYMQYREILGAHGKVADWVEIGIQDLELGAGC